MNGRSILLALTCLFITIGLGCTKEAEPQSTITLEEANHDLDNLIKRAVNQLLQQAQLEEVRTREDSACTQSEREPTGERLASRNYNVLGVPPRNVPLYFDKFRSWWQDNGFEVLVDDHDDPPRTLRVQNDAGFTMTLRANENDHLALLASSPCVWRQGIPEPE